MKQWIACGVFACAIPFFLEAGGLKGLTSAQLTDIKDIRPENLAFETAENGTRFISLRLRRQDASAVRVHIAGMRLGSGQKLYLSSGDGSRTYGPFEGAGPVQSGEFWSEAIEGSDVIVEFQAGIDLVPDLPFSIKAIVEADLSDVPTTVSEISWEGEQSVYEGDILIGNNLRGSLIGRKTPEKSAVAITGSIYRWPNGVMPYVIATNLPNQARITNAIAHWNTTMAGVVQMVPRTTETNYVVFVVAQSSGTCSSYVGRTGYGAQAINLGSYCSTGNVIHEIGHAFGLWHEHTREDRDQFVKVNWGNIQSGQSHNFTQSISNGDDLGVYDYNSIMHYNGTAFTVNGAATIETIPAGIPIGQRTALSTGDVTAIRQLYPSTVIPAPPSVPITPPPPVTVQTTIAANPSGAVVIVDGVNYVTPAIFDWAPGSTHTVSGFNGVTDGVRTTFSSWSDGGLLSHTVTAADSLPMLKVDYIVSYSLRDVPVPTGSVYISPAVADGFQRSGSSVTLVANSASGQCFSSWSGLIEGTPNRTKVTMTRPYDLTANFQTGSISLSASSVNLPAEGATYNLGVSASSGCTWGAHSSASWATVITGHTGTLSGTVTIQVAANTSSVGRTAMISVGSRALTINQAGTD